MVGFDHLACPMAHPVGEGNGVKTRGQVAQIKAWGCFLCAQGLLAQQAPAGVHQTQRPSLVECIGCWALAKHREIARNGRAKSEVIAAFSLEMNHIHFGISGRLGQEIGF